MVIDINKYLGAWHEIARIPTKYETNLTKVKAEYSLNNDGTIKIINSGYINGVFKQTVGTAKTTDKDDLLKVSFIPNIYSDYIILAITSDYKYALVGGQTPDFLWVLGRTTNIDANVYSFFKKVAMSKGYNTNKLEITKD